MQKDICYERLINLHQAGGESVILPSTNKTVLKIAKGGLFTDKSYLEGYIFGLKIDNTTAVTSGCVDADCIDSEGIWTTAITSDVSRDNNGITEYWVEGSLDINGDLWVLDLGIVSNVTGTFIFYDRAVSISTTGYFKSRVILPEGIKLAVLKKVSYSQATSILHYFGEYPNKKKLTRSKVGYLLNFTFEDQQTDLETLSIGLLCLLFSKYNKVEEHEAVFQTKGELAFYIKKIIEDNISTIADLTDYVSNSRRLNSIPKTLTTFINSNLIYRDDNYLNNTASCVIDDCVETDCLETKEIFITSSREVSTRALAWFYILIYSYSLYFNVDKYLYLLDLLAFYLVNQINTEFNLPSKGWTHNDVLANSEEILEYDLSTAVITYIALVKHYNYSSNSTFLEYAANIEEAIWSQLYNFKQQSFYNSLSSTQLNVENLSYALLFSTITNKANVVESLLTFIENNLTSDYGVTKESVNGISIVNLNKLSESYLITNPESINFTKLSNPATNLLGLSASNLLLAFSIKLAEELSYIIPLSIQNNVNTFLETLNKVEQTNNLIYLTSCLADNTLFSLEIIKKGDYHLTSSLAFERSYLLNRLLERVPVDFGWFSKAALQLSGNLYKLFSSITKSLALFSIDSKYKLTNNYISSLKEFQLTQYLKSLGFSRRTQELDSELIDYVTSVLGGEEDKITSKGLIKRLNRLGIQSDTKDLYNNILETNTIKPFLPLGEGYFSGNSYSSTNLVEISCDRPIDDYISRLIVEAMPIAVSPKVIEFITLFEQQSDYNSCVITEDIPADYLLLDSSNLNNLGYLLQESGDKFILE